jgi:hypothetical protein
MTNILLDVFPQLVEWKQELDDVENACSNYADEQKFTKDQVYYALNLSLLLRITRSIFIGRIYSSACCLLLSQNVSPFSPPKDFTIQSNICFSEHASSESFSSPIFYRNQRSWNEFGAFFRVRKWGGQMLA